MNRCSGNRTVRLVSIYALFGIAVCAVTTSSPCFADDGFPTAWLTTGGGDYYYIPPRSSTRCLCPHSIFFNAAGTPLCPPSPYAISDFNDWYGDGNSLSTAAIDVNGVFNTVYDVPVVFHKVGESAFPTGSHSDIAAGIQWGVNEATGEMAWSVIRVNLQGDFSAAYNCSTQVGKDQLSATIGHEVGHSIGMGHRDGASVMNADWNTCKKEHFVYTEQQDVAKIYRQKLVDLCNGGWGPAYFGEVSAEAVNEQGVELVIHTIREEDVLELVVRRAPSNSYPDDSYEFVAAVPMVNAEDGARYVIEDDSGQAGNCYMLDIVGRTGSVENRGFIVAGTSGAFNQDYPPGTIDALRADSRQRMKLSKWKSIFDGTGTVESVSDHGEIECDFLIISFADFVPDVAPICDYWEFSGMDVQLVACGGLDVTADEIRQLIAEANGNRPLKAVWLVGSTRWTIGDPLVDLVPTNGEWMDFYYSDITGDGLIDVPVGRLPARSGREVAFYVNKEMRYHWDVSWGGRKSPDKYSRVQVVSVPDNHASGSDANWGTGEVAIQEAGTNVAQRVGGLRGSASLDFLNSTYLPEWSSGNDGRYYSAIGGALKSDLADGRHVVFGLSMHHSYGDLYGAILPSKWQESGICVPGTPCERPCETFWFSPMCFSLKRYCNARAGGVESAGVKTHEFESYELFFNRGLLIFGSYSPVMRMTTSEVSLRMAELSLVDDIAIGHAPAIGEVWKQVHNEIRSSSTTAIRGLADFGIFGDPMLYIRGTYDAAAEADALVGGPLTLLSGPNPFNGIIEFLVAGLNGQGGELAIYDLRGSLVRTIALPTETDFAELKWDGCDNGKQRVASGVYVAIVRSGGRQSSQKVAYLK